MDRGSWWAAVHGISKSQIQLSNSACTQPWLFPNSSNMKYIMEFVLCTDLNLTIWFKVSDLTETIMFYKACLT